MSKQTKPTSLDKVRNALTEHGWEFTAESVQVLVPDYDASGGGGGMFRRSYVPKKQVDGYRVRAKSSADSGFYGSTPASFTAYFTESGAYLAQRTEGSYPFTQGMTVSKMLDHIPRYSKAVIEERKARQQQREEAQEQEEQRQVAEAYAEAQQALTEAKNTTHAFLAEVGLTTEQIGAVLIEVLRDDSVFAALAEAKTQVERRGKGWLPGSTSVRGIYVDGKRVG